MLKAYVEAIAEPANCPVYRLTLTRSRRRRLLMNQRIASTTTRTPTGRTTRTTSFSTMSRRLMLVQRQLRRRRPAADRQGGVRAPIARVDVASADRRPPHLDGVQWVAES